MHGFGALTGQLAQNLARSPKPETCRKESLTSSAEALVGSDLLCESSEVLHLLPSDTFPAINIHQRQTTCAGLATMQSAPRTREKRFCRFHDAGEHPG